MAALQIHREESPGTVTLRLEGTLDGRTAHQLRSSLDGLGAQEVVVDFSLVRDFKDTAVAVIARGIEARPLRLRGLPGHQARMFRYFGLATAETHERAYYKAEEILSV